MLMWLAMTPAMAGAQSLPPWKYPTTLASDPNTSRLFFAPTGRALKRGEAYVSVFEGLLPSIQIGVTDLFSIGGGTPIIPFEGASRPFWITPKLQVLNTAKTPRPSALSASSMKVVAGLHRVRRRHGG
jgi:hypothetical protein